MSAAIEIKPRGWLRRLWLACLVGLVLAWVILRGMWIYLWRGEDALNAEYDHFFATPAPAPGATPARHSLLVRIPARAKPSASEDR